MQIGKRFVVAHLGLASSTATILFRRVGGCASVLQSRQCAAAAHFHHSWCPGLLRRVRRAAVSAEFRFDRLKCSRSIGEPISRLINLISFFLIFSNGERSFAIPGSFRLDDRSKERPPFGSFCAFRSCFKIMINPKVAAKVAAKVTSNSGRGQSIITENYQLIAGFGEFLVRFFWPS